MDDRDLASHICMHVVARAPCSLRATQPHLPKLALLQYVYVETSQFVRPDMYVHTVAYRTFFSCVMRGHTSERDFSD